MTFKMAHPKANLIQKIMWSIYGMELESITLSEIRQSERDNYHMNYFIAICNKSSCPFLHLNGTKCSALQITEDKKLSFTRILVPKTYIVGFKLQFHSVLGNLKSVFKFQLCH